MKYVLDTNTLIYFFKGSGNVAKHLLSKPPSEITVPSIVLFELEVGIRKSTNPRKRISQLKEFLSLVNVSPFGPEEAVIASEIRVRLEKKGTPIGPYDVLIATTALSVNGILVSQNLKEFQRIKGLKTEDWY